MITKDQIMGRLPFLSHGELKAIHAMAEHLLGATTGGGEQTAPPLAEPIFSALMTALGGAMPYSSYSPTAQRQFEKKLPAIAKFLDSAFPGWDHNRLQQTAFLRMLMGLMVEDFKNRGVKPTIGMLITNLPRLPEIVDNAFPMYIESGLGKLILSQFQ